MPLNKQSYYLDFMPHVKYNICVAYSLLIGGDKMTRTGRPKAENPKDIKYSIRMDAELEHRLKVYCSQNGITKGQAIRTAIEMLLTKDSRRRK